MVNHGGITFISEQVTFELFDYFKHAFFLSFLIVSACYLVPSGFYAFLSTLFLVPKATLDHICSVLSV